MLKCLFIFNLKDNIQNGNWTQNYEWNNKKKKNINTWIYIVQQRPSCFWNFRDLYPAIIISEEVFVLKNDFAIYDCQYRYLLWRHVSYPIIFKKDTIDIERNNMAFLLIFISYNFQFYFITCIYANVLVLH